MTQQNYQSTNKYLAFRKLNKIMIIFVPTKKNQAQLMLNNARHNKLVYTLCRLIL